MRGCRRQGGRYGLRLLARTGRSQPCQLSRLRIGLVMGRPWRVRLRSGGYESGRQAEQVRARICTSRTDR